MPNTIHVKKKSAVSHKKKFSQKAKILYAKDIFLPNLAFFILIHYIHTGQYIHILFSGILALNSDL